MNVLHLVAGNLDEGAAKGAYILHENIMSAGVESTLLTNSFIQEGYKNIHTVSKGFLGRTSSAIRMKLDNTYKLFYEDQSDLKFSPGFFGFDFTKTDQYKKADILHLHWVCNGLLNAKDLGSIDKPIVWTLRDMWPMTGGCHYSVQCSKFEEECGACPHLGSVKENDLSRFLQKRKKRYYPDHITFIGISNWITRQAQKSSLLRDFSIHTISNNIDLNSFYQSDKIEAKNFFNLPFDKPTILVGAQYLHSVYKGYDILLKILDKLDPEIEVLLCGRRKPVELNKINPNIRYIGFLNDTNLQKAYSAADVFISPSRMEAFGKTVAEAMACGTPAVCFDETGSADIINHKKNGYLASPFSVDSMIEGIDYILNHEDYISLSKNAKEKVEKNFGAETIASQYIALYERLLSQNQIHA